MSYDKPQTETYVQPSSAFGATTEAFKIFGPKGKKGYVRDIEVVLTAAAVGTTTVPEVVVGATSGATEYARFRLGSAAGTGYAAGSHRATQKIGDKGTEFGKALEDFTGHVKLATAVIPADTEIFITRVAGVGGTPAGTGASRVIIDWV